MRAVSQAASRWETTAVSGFCLDTTRFGDRLVYVALGSQWLRYHDVSCGCGLDWVTVHAEAAGLTAVQCGDGWVALVGPGLTEDVDESALTADVLWEAVTGMSGDGRVEAAYVRDCHDVDRG